MEPSAKDRVSRGEVRRRLDVSTTQIRRWESEGRLTRIDEITDRGAPRVKYASSEVDEIARTWQRARPKSVKAQADKTREHFKEEGEACARAFEAFRSGWSKTRIVIELKLTPWYVDDLYEQYTSTLEDAADKRRRDRAMRADARAQRQHDREMARMQRRRARIA